MIQDAVRSAWRKDLKNTLMLNKYPTPIRHQGVTATVLQKVTVSVTTLILSLNFSATLQYSFFCGKSSLPFAKLCALIFMISDLTLHHFLAMLWPTFFS